MLTTVSTGAGPSTKPPRTNTLWPTSAMPRATRTPPAGSVIVTSMPDTDVTSPTN